MVTFQTPLAGIPPSQKDREASLSRSVSVPEIRIKSAFTLTFHAPFLSALSDDALLAVLARLKAVIYVPGQVMCCAC